MLALVSESGRHAVLFVIAAARDRYQPGEPLPNSCTIGHGLQDTMKSVSASGYPLFFAAPVLASSLESGDLYSFLVGDKIDSVSTDGESDFFQILAASRDKDNVDDDGDGGNGLDKSHIIIIASSVVGAQSKLAFHFWFIMRSPSCRQG